MRTLRHRLALTAAVALLGLTVTACGDDDGDVTDARSDGPSSAAGPSSFDPVASGDLGKICSGEFVDPGAAAYTTPAETKALVFYGPSEKDSWSSLPLGTNTPFGADTDNFQETSVLVCAEVAELYEEDAITCDGEADGPVTFQMVPATWKLTFREARTGAVIGVADQTVESQELGCRDEPVLAPDDVVYISPTGYDITPIVEEFVGG